MKHVDGIKDREDKSSGIEILPKLSPKSNPINP
jgi:hypothetical protein